MQLLVSSTSNIVKIPKKIHKISVDQANLRKWPNIPYYDLNVAVVRIMTLSEVPSRALTNSSLRIVDLN